MTFVNDSKATNFASTEVALNNYKNIHWIVGGIAKEKGIITSAYLCMYAEKSVNPDFMNLLFRIYDLKKVFYSFGGGIRQGAGYTEMRKIKVIVPTLKEQLEILQKVKSFSIEIEEAIQTTLKEIELIKEYQQSLISEVVTGKVDVSSFTL